jgi:hypothetical protein
MGDALFRTVVAVSDYRHCLCDVLGEGCIIGDEVRLASGCAAPGVVRLHRLSTPCTTKHSACSALPTIVIIEAGNLLLPTHKKLIHLWSMLATHFPTVESQDDRPFRHEHTLPRSRSHCDHRCLCLLASFAQTFEPALSSRAERIPADRKRARHTLKVRMAGIQQVCGTVW